jgi:glycine/D-amino acid oxidase-like deaminating enzyme
MIKILRASYRTQNDIRLEFSDGVTATFDLQKYLDEHQGSLLSPLHDATYAQRLFIDCGALCWPHGLELSPARLYEYTHAKKVA